MESGGHSGTGTDRRRTLDHATERAGIAPVHAQQIIAINDTGDGAVGVLELRARSDALMGQRGATDFEKLISESINRSLNK